MLIIKNIKIITNFTLSFVLFILFIVILYNESYIKNEILKYKAQGNSLTNIFYSAEKKAINQFCLDNFNSQTDICIQKNENQFTNDIIIKGKGIFLLITKVNSYKSRISKLVCQDEKSKSIYKECKVDSEITEDINKLIDFLSSYSYEKSKDIEKTIIKIENYYKENYPRYFDEYQKK